MDASLSLYMNLIEISVTWKLSPDVVYTYNLQLTAV